MYPYMCSILSRKTSGQKGQKGLFPSVAIQADWSGVAHRVAHRVARWIFEWQQQFNWLWLYLGVMSLFVVVMAVCVDGGYGSTFYGCTYGLYVKSCHDSSIMSTHQSILFNQIGNREFRQNTIFAAVTEKGWINIQFHKVHKHEHIEDRTTTDGDGQYPHDLFDKVRTWPWNSPWNEKQDTCIVLNSMFYCTVCSIGKCHVYLFLWKAHSDSLLFGETLLTESNNVKTSSERYKK